MPSRRDFAAIRQQLGLPPDPASDNIWFQRVNAGTHTMADAQAAIQAKAAGVSSPFSRTSTDGTIIEPTGPQGPTSTEAVIAQERARLGLPPDPASDRIWADRLRNGSATFSEASSRMLQKKQSLESAPGGVSGNNQAPPSGPLPAEPGVAPTPAEPTPPDTTPRISAETARLVGRQLGLPPQALDAFIQAYIKHGDAQLAIVELRDNPRYTEWFPGNLNADGTIVYNEMEYLEISETYGEILNDFGVPASILRGRIPELIQNQVSPQEFEGRLRAVNDRIANNIPEVQRFYAENYGIEMTPEAILTSAIDPDVGKAILERRLDVSEIGGEAQRFGFRRALGRLERLAQEGVNQQQARQAFSAARDRVPVFDRLAQRYDRDDRDFDIGEFEDAFLLSDTAQRTRLEQLLNRERAAFTPAGMWRREQTGEVIGLTER